MATTSKNYSIFYVFLVIFAIVMTCVIFLIQQSSFLAIKEVGIKGNLHYIDKTALTRLLKPSVTGSLLNIDTKAIQAAAKSLPWVEHIKVERVWPDKLELTVTEATVLARWNQQEYLSESGRILPPLSHRNVPVSVRLFGPDEQVAVVTKGYQQMQQDFSTAGLTITQLAMNKRRSWQVTLGNQLIVKLGRAESQERIRRFIKVYLTHLRPFHQQIAVMDMRYANGLSVAWKAGRQPMKIGMI